MSGYVSVHLALLLPLLAMALASGAMWAGGSTLGTT